MGDCKLKISIDRDECIGDGACANDAPETFQMDDEDKAIVLEKPGDTREDIIAAAEACPIDIIHVTDEETGKKLYPTD